MGEVNSIRTTRFSTLEESKAEQQHWFWGEIVVVVGAIFKQLELLREIWIGIAVPLLCGIAIGLRFLGWSKCQELLTFV